MILIDKDALKKDVLDLPNCYNGFSDTFDKACIIGLIDEQPTIEKRKKGKWIDPSQHGVWRYDQKAYSECSVCGKVQFLGHRMNFCPNCGADMERRNQ